MSEIIYKTYEFLDVLDNSSLIKDLTLSKDKLLKNKRVLEKIKDIQNEKDSKLLISKRQAIYKNNDYETYMKCYNELSLIVLKINKKYKEYTSSKEGCHG